MLVLIVVIAASSLAIFISDQQKNAQAQQALEQQKELEAIGVTSIILNDAVSPTWWSNITLNVASLSTEDSLITAITINDHYVEYSNITRNDGTPTTSYSFDNDFRLSSREQISLSLDLNGSTFYGDGNPVVKIAKTDYIKIDIFTSYQNEFSRTFMPPSAIAVVNAQTQYNGTGYTDSFLLDGSGSSATTDDSYIVAWDWEVRSMDGLDRQNLSGRNALVTPTQSGGYWANLTVTDSNGMASTCSAVFWATQDSVSPAGPSAIAKVITEMQWNASSRQYEPFLILDATSSSAADGAYIVYWNWTVNATDMHDNQSLSGQKVRFDNQTSGEYTMKLEVTDNRGLQATCTITYWFLP